MGSMHRKPKTSKLPFELIMRVRDVDGAYWDVYEARPSKHGFSVLYGLPVSELGDLRGGNLQLIATHELVQFWEANITKRDGIIFDLPAGRTTLKRMRRRLGFHWNDDMRQFWLDRIDDLRNLSAREFAERHGVNVDLVFDSRLRVLGPVAREPGWWTNARTLNVLKWNVPLRVIGRELDISISHAKRLKSRALSKAA